MTDSIKNIQGPDVRCLMCLESKKYSEFYRNLKICKKCNIKRNCKRLLCDCGRYYTYTHHKRHLKSRLHERRLEVKASI